MLERADSLKYLVIPQDHHGLLFSFVLGTFLPLLHDDSVFNERFVLMFGAGKELRNKEIEFAEELNMFTENVVPFLTPLIEKFLKPRLIRYLSDNKQTFLKFFDSEKIFDAIIQLSHQESMDAHVMLHILAQKLRCKISVYQHPSMRIVEYASELAAEELVSLLHINSHYYCLLDPMSLTNETRVALAPYLIDMPAAPYAEFDRLLKNIFVSIPVHLENLSRGVQAPPPLDDKFITEKRIVESNSLQFHSEQKCIDTVCRKAEEAGVQVLVDKDKDEKKDAEILWGKELAKFGASTMKIGLFAGSIGFSLAVPVLGLSALGVGLGLGFILSISGIWHSGNAYATQYKESLKEATDYLYRKKYQKAAEKLDIEFKRWINERSTRYLFLTPSHYAVAHFIRGVCAEHSNEYEKACDEYETAALDAAKGGQWIMYVVIQLQRIKLLRNAPSPKILVKGTNPTALASSIFANLTSKFSDIFADMYWLACKTIKEVGEVVTDINTESSLFEKQQNFINLFLRIDSLFALKNFAGGRGQFLEIQLAFYQSAILAFLQRNNLYLLTEDTKAALLKQFSSSVKQKASKSILELADLKFQECLQLLAKFKACKHPETAIYNESIALIIRFNEAFNNFKSGESNDLQLSNHLTQFPEAVRSESQVSSHQIQNNSASLWYNRSSIDEEANSSSSTTLPTLLNMC